MLTRSRKWLAAAGLVALAGCSSGPEPRSSSPPPAAPSPTGATGTTFPRVVAGADDSVGSIPGSPDAPYIFRFRMVDPASDRFSFQDRDLNFYFKPAPDALHFQIENRQNRPVWIDWEQSTFLDRVGRTLKAAHSTTRWNDRFQSQPRTQIPGLQRYSDYVLPMDYLLDNAGSSVQLHKQVLPEDATAPNYADVVFGCDLVFIVEDKPRTYPFRFRVVSVIPR
jgi:hypothetical protein